MKTIAEIQALTLAGKHAGPDGAVSLHAERISRLGTLETLERIGSSEPAAHRHLLPGAQEAALELKAYAVTIYSARQAMEVESYFREIAPALNRVVRTFVLIRDIDALEALSTHLWWWAGKMTYVPEGAPGPDDYRTTAEWALRDALDLSQGEPIGGHSRALLMTSYATVLFAKRDQRHYRRFGLNYLDGAFDRAPFISDLNQRVRVYKRLASGYVRHGRPIRGLACLYRAFRIRGVAPDVRAKLLKPG